MTTTYRVFACLDGDGGDDGAFHAFASKSAALEFISDAINPAEGWVLERLVRGRWVEVERDHRGAAARDR